LWYEEWYVRVHSKGVRVVDHEGALGGEQRSIFGAYRAACGKECDIGLGIGDLVEWLHDADFISKPQAATNRGAGR